MPLPELTKEQREEIALEEYQKADTGLMATAVMCKLAKLGIETEAENVELTTKATIGGKRYKIVLQISYTELENEEI